jgi:PPM family protein phosphatase
MKINLSYISHFGKIRKNNEDSILVHDRIISETNMELSEKAFFEIDSLTLAVADGMGGHSKGEVASRKVLEVLKDSSCKLKAKKYVHKFIKMAKDSLNDIAKKDKKSLGLGTTLSGLHIDKNKARLFSCGDSRIYKIFTDEIQQLTRDHSLVQKLYEQGIIQEEDMRTHPQKNIITSSISGDMGKEKPEIYYQEVQVAPGDKFLLCTDGLWESLTDEEMMDCLSKDSADEIATSLKQKSLDKYGRDNISLIYLEVLDI